jgi:CRP/FNR family transcriptional regulator, polysaccharide utilization system transcription regulator
LKKQIELLCEDCPAGRDQCFNYLDNADILYLNEQKTVKIIRKNDLVYEQGNNPLGIYCLREGKIKLFKNGKDGREHIVRIALPGEFVGLKALVSGNTHSVSAVAIEDSMLCFINKADFLQLMVKYPEFTRSIICILSKLLDDAEKRLISMAYKPVRERLAETLLFLHHIFFPQGDISDKTYLNLTRMDLANIIGVAPETVIRLLSDFKEEKLIILKGRKIFLVDPFRLQTIANIKE